MATERYLQDMGHRVQGRYSLMNYRFSRPVAKTQTILLHGGGNLGDLYYRSQAFREKVIAHYPENKIVVLPQTLHFQKPANLSRVARLFGRHRDLTLMLRDRHSYELALRYFPENECVLSPDMAHWLYPWPAPPNTGGNGALHLLRQDRERSPDQELQPHDRSVDWAELLTREERLRVYGFQLLHYWAGLSGSQRDCHEPWLNFVSITLTRLAAVFAGYSQLTTSRLHGHLFACLLDIPSLLLDNSYGKNRHYQETWLQAGATATMGFDKGGCRE